MMIAKSALLFVACSVSLILACYSLADEVVVEPVAVTGSSGFYGPGEGVSVFSRFWNRSNILADTKYDINLHGTVVFEGTGGSFGRGIWSSHAGETPRLRLGEFDSFVSDVFMSGGSIRLVDIDYPRINDSETIVIRGRPNNTPLGLGLWEIERSSAAPSASPRVVSLTDGPLGPQLGPGNSFSSFGFEDTSNFAYALNDQSQIAFSSRVGVDKGIWRQANQDSPDPLLLANSDGPLGPGLGPNIEFSIFRPIKIQDAGDVIVGARGDRSVNGVWKVSVGSTGRELLVANDETIDAASPFGFDFDRAEVFDIDELGNAALFLTSRINAFSNDFVGLGFAPVGKPAIQVAVNKTDGAGGPGLGANIEFGFSDSNPIMSSAVAADHFAFFATLTAGSSAGGIWLADADGNLTTVAIDPRVFTSVDVPRIEGLSVGNLPELQLTPHGDLVFLAGAQLWRYVDGELTNLIGSGLELDFDPTNGIDVERVQNVQSFSLNDSGWVVAEVQLVNNERALVRLNVRGIPEPSSLAICSSLGVLIVLRLRRPSRG